MCHAFSAQIPTLRHSAEGREVEARHHNPVCLSPTLHWMITENHFLFTCSCTCANSVFISVLRVRRVYNPASFQVTLWSRRDPLLYTVSRPLCAGPSTLEFMVIMCLATSRSLDTIIPLYQKRDRIFSGRLWVSRRTLPPSAIMGALIQ